MAQPTTSTALVPLNLKVVDDLFQQRSQNEKDQSQARWLFFAAGIFAAYIFLRKKR